ncbi:MAG: isoleucine--tRNA ligase, partial [Candidatus Nealsonbacteria bacterium CG10_big_fil_rev_8_21_14_0_10_37_25]
MSKSKGNVVDPWYIVEKYGADATRWYFYTINQPGDSKLFSEKDVEKNLKKFILTFWNSFVFFETYKTRSNVKCQMSKVKGQNILDKWIISRLYRLVLNVTNSLDKYDVTAAARSIENFVINDLSLWYIRRSRKRFKEAAATLNFVLLTLSKLTAPFIPFLSEKIYQRISYFPRWNLGNSVHLEDWPKGNKKLIDRKLERKMERVREIVSLTLAARAKAKIKIRQPLAGLQIANYELRNEPGLLELIKEEVNVKKIIFGRSLKLETKITPELKEEGMIREVIRNIQEMRK